ncbi:hypothetical protein BB560_004186 [Smittium megazygosporum]|uniref:Uncharacterized protein n=1 Tax=Smittium megazygosporum TaxID=133381 RepID=A0A2T9Z9W0_9FUNG|nr:hypothetical protein BB560_004186 [Smittium megazygosporum]
MDNSSLIAPNLFEQVDLKDSLFELLYSAVPPGSRPKRDATPNPAETKIYSLEEIGQLVQTNSWATVVLATRESISLMKDQEIGSILKYWTLRITSLVQLRKFYSANKEICNLEDSYRQWFFMNKVSGKSSNWITFWPFELCILRANLPYYAEEDIDTSINRICELISLCEEGNWVFVENVNNFLKETVIKKRSIQLSINLAGLLLNENCGFISKSHELFSKVRGLEGQSELDNMNWAFYYVAIGDWKQAKEAFEGIARSSESGTNYAAANNAAVCGFYLGNVPLMLQDLDKIMQEMPSIAGTDETLVFNYCSAVELACGGSWQRSLKVKKVIDVGQWAGDGFDIKVFKFSG